MPTIQQLSVKLVADDTGLKASLAEDKARAEATGLAMQEAGNKGKLGLSGMGAAAEEGGGKLQGFLGHVTGIAAGIGAVELAAQGFTFLKDQIGEMVRAGEEGNRIDAQLTAGLKATHGASGQTAASLEDLATKTLHLTGIDDDATKSAESMLLTFTNISGKTFPAATQAVADLATKMANGAVPSAQQMEQASIQLGKALNDPLHGYTALQRVGVTFTDQQKEQIKHFMAVGNVAAAQNVILKEMNHEFGGAAEAAGHANGGIAILQAQMEQTRQTIGQALIPVLANLAGAFVPILQAAADFVPAALKFLSDHADEAKAILAGLAIAIGSVVVPALWALLAPLGAIVGGMLAAAAPILAVGLAIAGLVLLFKHAMDTSEPFHDAVMGLVGTLKVIASIILGNLKAAFDAVLPLIKQVGEWVGTHLQAAFNAILPHITAFISWLNQGAMTLANQLGPALKQLGAWLTGTVVPALQQLGTWMQEHILPALQQFGTFLATQVLPTLQRFGAFLLTTVVPAIIALAQWIGANLLPGLQLLGTFLATVVWPAVQQVAGALLNFAQGIASRVVPMIQGLVAIVTFVANALKVILLPVFAAIVIAVLALKAVWDAVWPSIQQVLIGVWDAIKVAITTVLGIIGTVIGTAFDAIQNIVYLVMDLISGRWDKVWQDIQNLVRGVFGGILSIIGQAVGGILGIIGALVGGLLGAIGNMIGRFLAMVGGWKSAALSAVGNLVGGILGFFQSLPGKLFNLGKQIIQGLINGIGSMAGAVAGAVKNTIKGIPGIGGLASHIPGFASGGTTSGGLFYGAEDGPELLVKPGLYAAPAGSRVLNASDTAALLAGHAGGGGGMGGGGGFGSTIHIHGADAGEVFSKLRRESTLLRMSGRAG